MSRSVLIIIVVVDLFVVADVLSHHMPLFAVINALGGCYPWSPKEVEFKQGMTICPGQRAILHFEIRIDDGRI